MKWENFDDFFFCLFNFFQLVQALPLFIYGQQTLCEQLRQENNELRKKMEEDHHIRNRDLEQLR